MLLDRTHQQPEHLAEGFFMSQLVGLRKQFGDVLQARHMVDTNPALNLGPEPETSIISQDYPEDVANKSITLVGQIATLELSAIGLETIRVALERKYFGAKVLVTIVDLGNDLEPYQPHSYNPGSVFSEARQPKKLATDRLKGIITDVLMDGSFVVLPTTKFDIRRSAEHPYRIQAYDDQGRAQIDLAFL